MKLASYNRSLVANGSENENGNGKFSSMPTFRALASLRCMSPSLQASDVIGSIDYSENGRLFATGGIARKIRIYSYEALINLPSIGDTGEDESWEEAEDVFKLSKRRKGKLCNISTLVGEALDHDSHSRTILCTPAKLSSVKWKPGFPCIIGCGDYDGTVAEWDVEHGCAIRELHEHSGQRVYSLDYSICSPSLIAASASGDGTVKIWSHNTDKSFGVLKSPGGKSVCCAEFHKKSCSLMAIACADSNVYVYDLRNISSPYLSMKSHTRAASYVRWLATTKLVTASIDSSLKLWDIFPASKRPIERRTSLNSIATNACTSLENCDSGRTYKSHLNCKNFAGLSVNEDVGLIACGSETNEVFIYHQDDSTPVLQIDFPPSADEFERKNSRSSFVSSVCWKSQGDHYCLTAANSDGIVQVFKAQPAVKVV